MTSLSMLFLGLGAYALAQQPATAPVSGKNDLELVEKLLNVRKDYQRTLEDLLKHYIQAGDFERARWAEDELRQYHRIPKHAYRLELDVPPPSLQGTANVPEANQLYLRAMSFKDKGWSTDAIDNQRRAEILLQALLSKYPTSNKISETAYMLGDIYEKAPYKMYRRAAAYYERSFQWNPSTTNDSRLRAARLYDRQLQDRSRAGELYREVTTYGSDTRQIQEAQRRLGELGGAK